MSHFGLSPSEYAVVDLILAGKSTAEIAGELCLAYKTIATFRQRVFRKLDVKAERGLFRWYMRELGRRWIGGCPTQALLDPGLRHLSKPPVFAADVLARQERAIVCGAGL